MNGVPSFRLSHEMFFFVYGDLRCNGSGNSGFGKIHCLRESFVFNLIPFRVNILQINWRRA